MWYPFFIVGGMAWWVFSIFFFCILMVCVEEENSGMALACITIYILGIHIFGNADIWGYITGNWYKFLTYLILYILLGIVWSVIKLTFNTKAIKRKIQYLHIKFPDSEDFDRILYSNLSSKDYRRMKFEGCAPDILFWMSYWPVSALWTVVNDPVKRLIVWVYESVLKGMFKKVHAKALGDVLEVEKKK